MSDRLEPFLSLPEYSGMTMDQVAEDLYNTSGTELSKKDFYRDVLKYEEPGFTDEFKKGFTRNMGSIGVLAKEGAPAALKALLADVTGIDALDEQANEHLKNAVEQLRLIEQANPKAVATYKDAQTIKDKIQYLGGLMGEGVGSTAQLIPSLIMGGLGGAALKEAGKRYVQKGIKDAVAKTGAKMADEAIEQSMLKGLAGKLAQKPLAKYGAFAGATVHTTKAETGSTYMDLLREGQDAPGIAMIAGAIKGGLENLPEFAAFNRVTKHSSNALADATAKNILKRLGANVPKEILKTSTGEALTEVAQQEVDILAEQFVTNTLGSPQDIDELIDAGLAGFFGSVPFGAVAGGAQTYTDVTTPIKRSEKEVTEIFSEDVDPVDLTDILDENATQSEETVIREQYDLDDLTDKWADDPIAEHNAQIQETVNLRQNEFNGAAQLSLATEQKVEETSGASLTPKDNLLRRQEDIVSDFDRTGNYDQLLLDLEGQTPVAKENIFRALFPEVKVPKSAFQEDAIALGRELTRQREDEFARYTKPTAKPKGPDLQAKLPKDLGNMKPRYKTHKVNFENDLAKALYAVADDKTLSKRDKDILKWLEDQGVQNPRGLGSKIKAGLKEQANVAEDTDAVLTARLPDDFKLQKPLKSIPSRTPAYRNSDLWDMKHRSLRGNYHRINTPVWNKIKTNLQEQIQMVAGKAFTVEFMDQLQIFDNPLQANDSQTLRGAQAGNMIWVSLGYNTQMNFSNMETSLHEAFHAVYQSFTEFEKNILENNKKNLVKFVSSKLDLNDLDLDIMDTEELSATAFGLFARDKIVNQSKGHNELGPVRRLLQKIVNILKAFNRALRKENIKSFEDLFEDTLSGQYALDDIRDILDDNRKVRLQAAKQGMTMARADQLMNKFSNAAFVPNRDEFSGMYKEIAPTIKPMTNVQKWITMAFNTSPGLAAKDPGYAPIYAVLEAQNQFQNTIDKMGATKLHDIISPINKQRLSDASSILSHLDLTEQDIITDENNQIIYKDSQGNYKRLSPEVSKDVLSIYSAFKDHLRAWLSVFHEKITAVEGYRTVTEAIQDQESKAQDTSLSSGERKAAKKRLAEFKAIQKNITQIKSMINSKKAYFPRSSMGEYGITLRRKDGKEAKYGFAMIGSDWNGVASKKEFDEVIKRWKEELGYSEKEYVFPKYENIFEINSPDAVRHLKKAGLYESIEFLVSALSSRDSKVVDAIEKEMYEVVNDVRKMKINPTFLERKDSLLPSKDYASMVSNYFANGNRTLTRYRFSDLNAQVLDALDGNRPFVDPVTKAKVSIPRQNREYYKKLFEYNLSAEADHSRLRAFNFFWALGGNVSTAALQLLTLPIQVVGLMNAYTGNFVSNNAKVAANVKRASGILSSNNFKGIINLSDYETVLKRVNGDVRLANAIVQADRFGIFKPGRVEDYLGIRPFSSGLVSGKITDKKEMAVQALRKGLGGPIQIAEEVSRLSAFLSLYDTLREDVHGGDALAKLEKNYLHSNHRWKAKQRFNPSVPKDLLASLQLIEDTHAVFGKLGRGVNQQGFSGSMLFPFMQHPLMMLGLMARLWKASPEGRMSVSYMMAATFLMSGMFAIPGWEMWKTFLEKGTELTTGEKVELNYEIAKWLNTGLGMSPEMIEFIEKGALYSALDVDISRRVGLPILGGDHIANMLSGTATPEEFLGVAGSYAKGIRDNMNALQSGDVPESLVSMFAPISMKNLLKAYNYSVEGPRTNRGVQLMTPEEFSVGQAALKAFGFQPAQVSRESEKRWVERLGSTGYRNTYNRYTSKLADLTKQRIQANKQNDIKRVNELSDELMAERRKLAAFASKVGILDRAFWKDVNTAVSKKLNSMYFPDVPRQRVPQVERERPFLEAFFEKE